jgi:hypothetical protein
MQAEKSIHDRILSRLGPAACDMGGGGGGSNPAAGATQAFGQAIGTVPPV